jgi:hypothetical protein
VVWIENYYEGGEKRLKKKSYFEVKERGSVGIEI